MPKNVTDEAVRETIAVAFERREADALSRPTQISAGSTARRQSHFCAALGREPLAREAWQLADIERDWPAGGVRELPKMQERRQLRQGPTCNCGGNPSPAPFQGAGSRVVAPLPAAATQSRGKPLLRTRNSYSLAIVRFLRCGCGRLRSLSYGRRNTAKVTPVPPGNSVAGPTQDDIRARIHTVEKTFTPGTPVSSLAELVGREASLRELLSVVASPGRHAFIVGGRGTGKTSMVSCFLDCASRAAPQITCVRTNCGNSSKITWNKVLRRVRERLGITSTPSENLDISGLDVEFELARLQKPLLLVFDDFDEILVHT
ncbi:AAA family ATPase [Methylocystis hirsuta]|uniref:AAA family ATPase n=1 Tax=Methylocystis hirsuta TaxID=369798 RepID=UPI0026A3C14C